MLERIDWIIIGSFLAISLFISFYFKNKASGSLSDFFLGGRNLPWYIAGVSMVATTFAADTPLWVAEVVRQHGISGNWLWWNMLIGGMLTTFFFAKLWRRANVLTELEFIELRYAGLPAKWLRGFKSVYMGVFLNAVIIGWVNAAMVKILTVFFGIDSTTALWWVAGLMALVAIYSSVAGLLGVAFTDAIQFTLAMAGCIILAVIMVNSEEVGGMSALINKLEPWQIDFFPTIGGSAVSSSVLSISTGAFLSFIFVQWWASWYPGAEPGGGGYVAQRMMSTKNEEHSLYATLFFQIAHYCLRPWPWIVVGLCCLVVYPDLTEAQGGEGFVMAIRDFMPAGFRGLLLAAFLGAYMSTISTQLNWGASLLTNDLYKRFFAENKNNKHYVNIARVFTVVIMLVGLFVTTQITMIDQAARFLIVCGAGLGAVLILRWYWWRINVWSEITATIAPLLWYSISNYVIAPQYAIGDANAYLLNEGNLLFTATLTTLSWIIVTYLTPPENKTHLEKFYERVKPGGFWGVFSKNHQGGTSKYLFIAWIAAVVMTYGVLFSLGKFIFLDYNLGLIWLVVTIIAMIVMRLAWKRHDALNLI